MRHHNPLPDPTRLAAALEEIEGVQRRLAAQERFRGYRSASLALTGLAALAAAWIQGLSGQIADLRSFVDYWLMIAAAALTICAADVIVHAFGAGQGCLRRQTRAAAVQFLPTLGTGALVTWALYASPHEALLPGLWAVVFGLAVLASRPALPRAAFWVAVFFVLSGVYDLSQVGLATVPDPWFMGLVFGGGHLALAAIIRQDEQERGEFQ